MAEDQNKIIFGAEFEGQGITQGVDDILSSLEKAREAEVLLKTAIQETTAAMKVNRKEAEALSKSKPLDPKLVQLQVDKLKLLNKEYDQLVRQNVDLTVASKKTTDVIKTFNQAQGQSTKNTSEFGKAISKLTNVSAIAADGVKKFGNFAKDAAFGMVSGFAGGIIAVVIPALIDFVSGLVDASDEVKVLARNKKILNEVFNDAAKAVGNDVAKLEVYRTKLNDTNIPAAERVKIAKEYNKTADETNKIDLKQIDNLQLINEKLEAQNKLIIQRAISTAALAKLGESATKFIDLQLQVEQALKGTSEAVFQAQFKTFFDTRQALGEASEANTKYRKDLADLDKSIKKTFGSVTKAIGLRDLIKERNKAEAELKDIGNLLNPLITTEGLTTKDTTKTPAAKVIENVFAQKLAELKARLASVSEQAFQSEGLIREKFAAQLDKEFFDIGKLLKEKKLTTPQADILKGLLKQINDVELSKGLEEFRKKQVEALKQVNDLILGIQIENETKRINNIRDEFTREQALIQGQFDQSVAAIEKRSEDFNKKVDEDTKKNLISPTVARRKKLIAAYLFGGLTEEAEKAKLNAEVDLAFKQFQKTLDIAKDGFEAQILEDNEGATRAIREQTGMFLEGKISYEKYQKNLTEILERESMARRKILLEEAQDQLNRVQGQLGKTTDPKQRRQLEEQIAVLRGQISALEREIATGKGKGANDAESERIQKFLNYVNAVQKLGEAVIGFWQQVNQAEAAALDRSIALQNKRVENAREIADKGNAEFLEMEQKRLDELERKREENARKQLAINNALVASQALVAAISAIAQAVQTGSPFAAFAAVASVIGAIGAVYSFVASLQPQEANFFEGTEYVDGPAGRDKVKAKLTRGERVVTAKDNEDYWEALQAIHTHAIPAEDLNSFVAAYPNIGVPVVDFDRLSSATDGKIGADSHETLGRLDKLNDTMEQVVVGLGELGINVKMDEHGFEASISKVRKARLLRSRS